ncbi:MAG: ATPase [Tissierellia bacterium]|nr:ATPase [Tissierellia bacterium]
MLDLESKISSFRKMIWDYEKQKSEKQLYDSTEKESNNIKNKEEELKREQEEYLNKRREFYRIKKNELVSKNSEELKKSYLKYKSHLLEDLLEDIKDKLLEYTKTEEYKNKLKDEVEQNFDFENEILLVKEQDKAIFKGNDYNIDTLDDKYIGGFMIVDKNKVYRYDYTLLRKLRDKHYDIGKKLYKLLESDK